MLVVLLILFVFSTYGLFRVYSGALSDEFYQMSVESMNDYTSGQKIEVLSALHEVQNTISAMRVLAESPDVDPQGETFTTYLASWNSKESFQVNYVTIEALKESLDDPGISENDRAVFDLISKGQDVITDVRHSNRLGGYYYGIGEPVMKGGAVVGALRSIINAEELLKTSQRSSQVNLLASCLIKSDGKIIAVNEEQTADDGKCLYQLLADFGYSEETITGIKNHVKTDEEVSTLKLGEVGGRMLFCTTIRLGVNDWTIVNFTEESKLADHSAVILHDTVITGTILVGASVVASIALAYVFSRMRRNMVHDSEHYALLAEFSDTMMLEYSYLDDTLELSPNAEKVFELDSLRLDHYLKRGYSLLEYYNDDYEPVLDLFASPQPGDVTRAVSARVRVRSGECRWFSFACRYLFDGSEPYAAIVKIVDITEHRQREERLVRQSQIDGLTKMYNKVTIEAKVARLMEMNQHGLLFVIDVDNFKRVNDEHGHSVGDQVLTSLAAALFDVFRRHDPVGRIGGDEFVAYVSDSDDVAVAVQKRAALDAHAAELSRHYGFSITLSVGVAYYPADGTTYQELFDAADQAMYADKRQQ